jgi:hypothetical protein
MAIKTTRWSPDTCVSRTDACAVEYDWDDAVAESDRTHTLTRVVRRCSRHTAVTLPDALYAALLDENPRKNRVLERLRTTVPARFDANGVFLDSWRYTEDHVLEVTISGVNQTQRRAAQDWCDANLGAGKVVIR